MKKYSLLCVLILVVVSFGCSSYDKPADATDEDSSIFVDIPVDIHDDQGADGRDSAVDVRPDGVEDADTGMADVPVDVPVDTGDDDVLDAADNGGDAPVDVAFDDGSAGFDILQDASGTIDCPDTVDAGHAAAGTQREKKFTIVNRLDVPVAIGPVEFGDGGCGWLSVAPVEARELQPDESIEITLTLAPAADAQAGECNSNLFVTTNLAEQASIMVSVTSEVTRPVVSTIPAGDVLTLPTTIPGCQAAPTLLKITNDGEGTMWVDDIVFAGPAGFEITVSGLPGLFPVELAAGGTQSIDLQFDFAPSAVGTYTGTLFITTDAVNGEGFEIAVQASSAECQAGTHECSCICVPDSSVNTCGDRCVPCTSSVSGAQPICLESGGSFVCGSDCGSGSHQCGSTCKLDTDPNACGASCTLCYARSNSTRACVDGACALNCNSGWDNCDGIYDTGCETSLNTDANCGVCRNKCTAAPEHGIAACVDRNCSFTCQGGYHKEGEICAVNDNDDCCGFACTNCAAMVNPMPYHTTGRCVGLIDFSCEMICEPEWFSTSGGINDGCECHYVSEFDQPGNGVDEDCNGSDGNPDLAFYVSTNGADTADGSKATPFRTVQKGINAAKAAFIKKRVFISAGTYEENLVIDGPISLFGGFSTDGNWTWSASNTTTIKALNVVSGRTIAIDGANMTTRTWISGLNIVAGSTVQADNGADVFGIKCSNCSGLGIVGVMIAAGPGGNVVSTARGATGTAGGAGVHGEYYITPGSGGTSGCGREGGVGGMGGFTSYGDDGAPGKVVGAGGGAGGVALMSSATDGGPGASCTQVGSDRGGAETVGGVAGGYWVGTPGTNGDPGCDGHGGGGGGGGPGYYSDTPEYGSGGGGGGGGGCGGAGGPGGKAGGASIGVFLHNSTGVTIVESIIRSSNAGNGGPGGQGGVGGAGGAGGGAYYGSGGWAGDGGVGGSGSAGGWGGGGAGGISYGIYMDSTIMSLPGTNVISHGNQGMGGSTQGVKNAVDGTFGDFNL